MNISKISRSIVVVIFIASIIFLGYLDVLSLINESGEVTNSVTSTLVKIGFVIAVIFLVLIYMYIKDKLYKMHVKRKITFIYRYIYIVLVILIMSLFTIRNFRINYADNMVLFYVLTTLIISLIIKRIIFNVSKSDILSVLGMFTYVLLPRVVENKELYIASTILNIIFFLAIYIMQILIDELKQKGVKTKKYIVLSTILGIFMGLSSLVGVSVWIWLALSVVLFFLTYNLDNTHISFPKKFMASLTQQKRESLYKIERININKLIVSIIVIVSLTLVVHFTFSVILTKMNNNEMIETMLNTIHSENTEYMGMNIRSIFNRAVINGKNLVTTSKMFYIILFIYILFMEALAFFLHRRYDTKSTVMKMIFILLFVAISIFNLNMYYYQSSFTILLILIAIVNTSNIYLNREERIKLLVS